VSNQEDLVLIVDGLNLFTRHYVAHPALSTNGSHIGGIVGFLYGVVNLVESYKPRKVVIAWEGGGSTRRRNIYKDYKSKREKIQNNVVSKASSSGGGAKKKIVKK